MDVASDVASLPPGTTTVLAFTSGDPEAPALRPVHGRHLLCYLLDELDSLGISQAILYTDKAGDLANVFGERYRGMKLCYGSAQAGAKDSGNAERAKAGEGIPLATWLGSAFSLCEGKPLLAIRGLRFLSEGLGAFASKCASSKAPALLAATRNEDGGENLALTGICWLRSVSPQSAFLSETLLATDPLATLPTERLCVLKGSCIDPEADPARIEAFLKPRSAKGRAVFLDRDGTVNVEKHYLYRPEELEFIDGMPEFIAMWRRWGYRIIVATNQSGIARGYYGEEDMEKLHSCMNKELEGWGAHIDAFYHCPHHPGITGPCHCRKPSPGLIEKAVFDFNLDPAQCLLFCDKDSDILAGQACGIFSVKVRWGSGLVSMPNRVGSSLQTKSFP